MLNWKPKISRGIGNLRTLVTWASATVPGGGVKNEDEDEAEGGADAENEEGDSE